MGPRFFNRGNARDGKHPHHCFYALQWGRGFSTAETTLPTATVEVLIAASMGPRFFNRGNAEVAASFAAFIKTLQWGRGFSTAETSSRQCSRATRRQLQWA